MLNTRKIRSTKYKDYLSSLDRIDLNSSSPRELGREIDNHYTDSLSKGIRNFFNYLRENEYTTFNGYTIEEWLKHIKIQPTGVREIFINDEELRESFKHVREPILLEALAFSGTRYSQLIEALDLLDRAYILNGFVRIPTRSLSKGTKKSTWIYLPLSTYEKLKVGGLKVYAPKDVQFGKVSANSIRKWFTGKMLEWGIEGNTIDFIQGRTPGSILARHYMDRTLHADREYSKIVDRLLKIFDCDCGISPSPTDTS